MKKIISCLAALLAPAAVCMAQTDSIPAVEIPQTEEDVMFGVLMPQSRLNADNAALLESKMEQIIGRCNAGASATDGFFVVVPTVNAGELVKTEGLMQNVASQSGELVLAAKNRFDGSVYYTTTVPLKAAAKGDHIDADKLLISSIKPSDAVYVRFVRNARANILKHVASHPESLRRPAPAPKGPADGTPAAAGPAVSESPASPSPEVALQPAHSPAPAPQPEIFISDPGWSVQVKSCSYDATYRTVTLTLSVANTRESNRNGVYMGIRNAIRSDGGNFREFDSDQNYHDFPYNVPVNVALRIKNVYSNPGELPYVEVALSNGKIEIRNLPVI